MLRYLLDTNVVSQPMMKTPSVSIVRKLTSVADECAIAAPVWHELHFVCGRMPAGKRRNALQDYLADVVSIFEILPYDDLAANLHAAERARLEALGIKPSFADGQVAAIAQVNQLVLVTTEVHDFAPFTGIKVENWA